MTEEPPKRSDSPDRTDTPTAETEGSAPDEALPRVGPYRLLQKVGEGGMGEVYAAEQETPVRRKVALKAIKAGMDTRQVVARFESERQALALMDHPNIASVFDAGATMTGEDAEANGLEARAKAIRQIRAKNHGQ